MNSKTRITVVGGGIAGYPAAIRAARLGAEVTLIEKDQLGGTCLNRGCIPTKALLQAADVLRVIKHASEFGIQTKQVEVDYAQIQKRKEGVVLRLRKGIHSLLTAKRIRLVQGQAAFLDPRNVKIEHTGERIENDHLILATGSCVQIPPIPGLESIEAWDSSDFLSATKLPVSCAIIGGGVVGVELAQILCEMGSQVTILEVLEQLVPGLDYELSAALQQSLSKQGIQVVLGARVHEFSKSQDATAVSYTVEDVAHTLQVERVIMATGRKANLEGLGALGLGQNEGALQVDERLACTQPGVWAAGDVTGKALLAHVASAQGECAARNALGAQQQVDYDCVPSCIYTHPEVAWVGLTEKQAAQEHAIMVGRFPFQSSGKAAVLNQTFGLVKIVVDKTYKQVLGVHIIGPHATELIAEAVLSRALECTVDELAHLIHPHPTLTEAVMEAAQSLAGGAIHLP